MGREEDGGEDSGTKDRQKGALQVGPRRREPVLSSPLGLEKQGLGWGWAKVRAEQGHSPRPSVTPLLPYPRPPQ